MILPVAPNLSEMSDAYLSFIEEVKAEIQKQRISVVLNDAFPEMSGFSPRNIKYMRKFAESWPDFEIVQQVVAQFPWRTQSDVTG